MPGLDIFVELAAQQSPGVWVSGTARTVHACMEAASQLGMKHQACSWQYSGVQAHSVWKSLPGEIQQSQIKSSNPCLPLAVPLPVLFVILVFPLLEIILPLFS